MQPLISPLANVPKAHAATARKAVHHAATHAANSLSPHISVVSLLGRLAVSLLVVLGVLWGLAQIARRRSRATGGNGLVGKARGRQKSLEVVSRQSLGKGQALVTVRVGEQVLLLGVTQNSIRTLSEFDAAELEEESSAHAGAVEKRTSCQVKTAPGLSSALPRANEPHPESWAGRIEHWRSLTVRR